MQHLTNLRAGKKIRENERRAEQARRNEKTYEEYNWLELVLRGELGKLKVVELDKYLDQHKLNKKGRKRDKLDSITADVLRKEQQNVIEEAMEQMVNEEESGDGSDDDDLVVEEIGTESSTSSEVESEAPAIDSLPLIVRTQYERDAGHWNLFQMN
jgi:hypothetical protein